jgi:ribonuclease VapC
MKAVLDSSALLALLWGEPGSEVTRSVLPYAVISAVNLAEVCTKLADHGLDQDDVRSELAILSLKIVSFDERQAYSVGNLRHTTRQFGLSLGDRACLGLAEAENATAVTADRNWPALQLGIEVKTIR